MFNKLLLLLIFALYFFLRLPCCYTLDDNNRIYETDIIFGNKNASTIVIEYFSPSCYNCAIYKKNIWPKIKSQYIDSGKIAYVIREFISTKQDLYATILARCKGDTSNSYIEVINLLFLKQNFLISNKDYKKFLYSMCSKIGITQDQYNLCINDSILLNTIIKNTQFLLTVPSFLGIPAFFINGKHYLGPQTLGALSHAIDNEIRQQNNY